MLWGCCFPCNKPLIGLGCDIMHVLFDTRSHLIVWIGEMQNSWRNCGRACSESSRVSGSTHCVCHFYEAPPDLCSSCESWKASCCCSWFCWLLGCWDSQIQKCRCIKLNSLFIHIFPLYPHPHFWDLKKIEGDVACVVCNFLPSLNWC